MIDLLEQRRLFAIVSVTSDYPNLIITGSSGNDSISLEWVPVGVDVQLAVYDGNTLYGTYTHVVVGPNYWDRVSVDGSGGNDTLKNGLLNQTANLPVVLNGNAGDDTLTGGFYQETLLGGAGRDLLSGLGSGDSLQGQGGNDTLLGGAGDDKLFGEADNDSLVGGAGRDSMVGGSGTDTVQATGDGIDTLKNDGVDTLFYDVGYDVLV